MNFYAAGKCQYNGFHFFYKPFPVGFKSEPSVPAKRTFVFNILLIKQLIKKIWIIYLSTMKMIASRKSTIAIKSVLLASHLKMYKSDVHQWIINLFHYMTSKPRTHTTKTWKRKCHTIPASVWFHNGTCLIWSVFTSLQDHLWDYSAENVLCRHGNHQSRCRDTSLRKAAAQQEHSIYEGKSFNKALPIS